MEVWEAASILGMDESLTEDVMDFGQAGRRTLTEADRRRLEQFGQAPETNADITNRVMQEMGIHTR